MTEERNTEWEIIFDTFRLKDMLYITGTSIIVVFVVRAHNAKVKSYDKDLL